MPNARFKYFLYPLTLFAIVLSSCGNNVTNISENSNNSTKAKDLYAYSGDLVISELMYHPISIDSAEFIELYNSSDKIIPLSGIQITGGIEYTFPEDAPNIAPGKHIVLTQSVSRFKNAYPDVEVYDQYLYKLKNTGEEINILSSIADGSSEIFSLEYSDDAPWPVLAGGMGYSINLINGYDPRFANSWFTSSKLMGTPGESDMIPEDISDYQVLITEVMPYSPDYDGGWAEICNFSTTTADISGWFFSTKRSNPAMHIFASGTTINSYECIVISNKEESQAGLIDENIELNYDNNQVYLFGVNSDGYYNGYTSSIKFPTMNDNSSYGLIAPDASILGLAKSPELLNYSILSTPTPYSIEANIALGNIIISEINYHPLDVSANESSALAKYVEFIELENINSDPIILADPSDSNNTWNISGIAFDFPAGTTILGLSKLLLIKANNATEEEFRIANNIDENIQILTYDGKLSNRAELIRLKYPLTKTALDNLIQYNMSISDECFYNDTWYSKTDGEGYSLQRTIKDWGASINGNSNEAWISAEPTPGL